MITLSHQAPGQLVDGHWVLAFADALAAKQAAEMLQQAAAQLHTLYATALGPLLAAVAPEA